MNARASWDDVPTYEEAIRAAAEAYVQVMLEMRAERQAHAEAEEALIELGERDALAGKAVTNERQ